MTPKITEVTPLQTWIVRFSDGRTFARTGPDLWFELRSESEEVVYDAAWLEAAWREWVSAT